MASTSNCNLGNEVKPGTLSNILRQAGLERITMTGYAIIIEGEGDSYSAYAPELLGCIATGKSIEEVEALMREAIGFHLEMMKEHGEDIPEPTTVATAIADVAPAR